MAAKTSGIVLEILAEEGDYVESGRPLAKLDDEEALLALREAKLKRRTLKGFIKFFGQFQECYYQQGGVQKTRNSNLKLHR